MGGDAICWDEEAPIERDPEMANQEFNLGCGKFGWLLLHPRCQVQAGYIAQWCWEERSGLEVDSGPSQVAEATEDGEFWGWAHGDLFLLNTQIILPSA